MLFSVAGGKFHKLSGPVDTRQAFKNATSVCGLNLPPLNYFESEESANSYTGGRLSTYLCKHCAAREAAPAHDNLEGWTIADSRAAITEGWDVFDCDGSDNGRFQICKRDDMTTFDIDDDVWVHVAKRATDGSALHVRALAFIMQHNPIEYNAISNTVRVPVPMEA